MRVFEYAPLGKKESHRNSADHSLPCQWEVPRKCTGYIWSPWKQSITVAFNYELTIFSRKRITSMKYCNQGITGGLGLFIINKYAFCWLLRLEPIDATQSSVETFYDYMAFSCIGAVNGKLDCRHRCVLWWDRPGGGGLQISDLRIILYLSLPYL